MFVNTYYSFYFYKNPIRAIIDNDLNKWGKTLLGFPIISPGHIKKYPFDKILLCSHYQIITKQISNEFKLETDKVITKEEFIEQIYQQLLDKHHIFDENILIVEEKERFLQLKDFYTALLIIVDIIDYSYYTVPQFVDTLKV